VPFVDEALMKKVEERVIIPTIQGLQKDKITYKGFIYIGFMQTEMPNGTTEPFVIEYNCRMGDPETEIVFPRIKSDLVQHFVALAKGELQNEVIETDPRAAATVIVASGGYPEDYQKGIEITGLHAGTKAEGGKVLTNGGRVLAVTSYGKTITEAVATSNAAIEKINFDGKYYRRDIGFEFKSTPGV
jgi:phosphoribosylamine--glycine ligase